MAANKKLNIEPFTLSSTAALNYLNCSVTSLAGPVGYTQTEPYLIVRHVRAVNNDSSSRTVKFFKGTSGGSASGTEIFWPNGASIPAGQWIEWYGYLRFDAVDFLTAAADIANKVTVNIDGAEIGIS